MSGIEWITFALLTPLLLLILFFFAIMWITIVLFITVSAFTLNIDKGASAARSWFCLFFNVTTTEDQIAAGIKKASDKNGKIHQ